MLHWLIDLVPFFRECRRVLKADGLLLFTMVGPNTLMELRQCFSAMGSNNHIHRFIDMHDIGDALIQCGLMDPVMDMENVTMTYSSTATLFKDLKATGAHNARMDRQRGLMGKQQWHKMLQHYESYREHNVLPATYEIIYGHAWAPQHSGLERVNSEGEVYIPVSGITKKGGDNG